MIAPTFGSQEILSWQVQGICRQYGRKTVLQDVSFSLSSGQVLGLFGPNGSGKSTLLDIVALAARPSGGRILLNGSDVLTQLQAVRPLIGYVPQDIALFEELTVRDNLLCWSRLPGEQARQRIRELSAALGLEAIAGQKIAALSGGMKRWVNLAVALLGYPALLVLDEPFAGVDMDHREAMQAFLKALARQGVSQIISGHAAEQLLPLVDQVMIMREGHVLYYDDLDAFMKIAGSDSAQMAIKSILSGDTPCGS